MAKLSEFATTEEIETGHWFIMSDPTETKPMRLLIRSIASQKYRTEERKLQRTYRPQLIAGDGTLKPEDQDEYDATLAQRGLVANWENVEDPDGNPIQFSAKNAHDVLLEYRILRHRVFMCSRNDEAYKPAAAVLAEREQLAGNSPRLSGTPHA